MPDFGSTPTSTRSLGINQFPVSAAFVPNSDPAGGLTSIEGIAVNTDSNGYTTTAIRLGLKNGDDVTQGNTTDAAVTGDTAGTLSAKMRGLNKILADVWDSTNHRVKVDGSSVTQPVSAAAAAIADLAALTTAMGATTASQTGPIIQGLVTTNNPAYTTGTIQPISISTNGSLRVQPNISGSGIVGGNGTTNAQTQRVTLSSDSTGQVTLAAGSALVGGAYLVDSGGTNKAAVDASGKQSFKAATGDVADLSALTTAQGVATGAQTGPIIQGLVTTNNPAYTTGTIQPISLTTNGALRVLQSISGAAIVGGNGTTTAQTQRVTLSSDSTGQVTLAAGSALVGGAYLVDSGGTNKAAVDSSGRQSMKAATGDIADLSALTTAQGAASASQTGPIIQGLVTTNNPAYTTGTIQPISISTNGSLRVQSNISGSGIVGGNGTTNAQTQRVTLSSDSTGQVTLAAGSALVGGAYLVDSGGTNKASVDASGYLGVNVKNANANGQNTMFNSSPVVPASDYVSPVKSVRTEIAGQAAGSVTSTSTDLVPATDVTGYTCAVLQLTGTWSMTLQPAQCNDSTNWLSVQTVSAQTFLTNTGVLNSISSNGLYVIPLTGRYLRIRPSAWTSNASCVGTLELYTTPPPFVIAALGTYATLTAATSNVASDFHLISAATTNATSIKASTGQIYGYEIYNSNAAARYVKFYNTAGTPTAGSSTPLRVVGVPPGGRAFYHTTIGISFSSGIGMTTTTGIADNDTTAVGASDLSIEVEWR